MSPDLPTLLRDAPAFRPTAVVTAVRLENARTWRTRRGSRLHAAAGDWLLSDEHGEWTVDHDVFARTYRRLPDGRWAKYAPVRAVRMAERVEVPTLEGSSVAEVGDWVLAGPGGELWPVTEEQFRRTYVPAGEAG